MCDYSLMMTPNRLAAEGEQLVAHRFWSGSTGLVSSTEFTTWQGMQPRGFWQTLKCCFSPPNEPEPVVCIPPGARLRLEGIPQPLRERFGFDFCEDATFTQISADESLHRDALIFPNGSTLMLQSLPEGQMLKVLSLSSSESREPGEAERLELEWTL